MIVLQKFDHKESRYERPQDKWVCGHLADGSPCALGPGKDGRCRVTAVCQPRMENGRWQCRRSAQEGGPCDGGPFPDGRCCLALEPCVPQPSLRTKRKRASLWATAIAVGVAALIVSGGAAHRFLLPGALSSHHAGLTECQTCHAGSGPGKMDWIHQFTSMVGPKQNAQLCIGCHNEGPQPLAPHTHPVAELQRITQALKAKSGSGGGGWLQRIGFSPSPANPAPVATEVYCATCHKEHQGVFNDLKKVSNDRCQICHIAKFAAFADTHPQFTRYPYDRRTRLIFDHVSHIGKHFLEAAKSPATRPIATPGCSDCHLPGVDQKYMEVKSFDTTCASCHIGDIRGTTRASGPKGIDFLSVPGLDVATLAEHGIDIGDWPKRSEAVVTPFMRLLLAANGEYEAAGVTGLDLLDLTKAKDADLAKVKNLAWAVKRIFSRLETTRLETAISGGRPTPDSDRQRTATLTGSISHDVIVGANQEWFPNLADDLQRHDKGQPTRDFKPPEKKPQAVATPTAPAPAGGSGGTADILTPTPGGAAATSDILSAPAGAGDNSSILSAPAGAGDNSAILSAPAGAGDSSAILSAPAGAGDSSSILSAPAGAGDSSSILSAPAGAGEPAAVAAQPKSADTPKAPFDPEAWAEFGGWYRQDFSIRYRPSGHADPFLRAWLDFASQTFGTIQQTQLAPVFDLLAPSDAIGRCTKCHSIDARGAAKTVNWQPFRTDHLKNRFTTFNHLPHNNAVGSRGCVACHELQPTSGDYAKTFAAGNPRAYSPNFKFMDKPLCATCHARQAAWESCTLCHNYHVSLPAERASVMVGASLPAPPGARPSAQIAGKPGP